MDVRETINLLKIHKRRKAQLEKQRAFIGTQTEVSVNMEINDISDKISELESDLRRYLHKLKLEEAAKGISTDPCVLLKIEDIEEYFNV